jgi:hypothetical protein
VLGARTDATSAKAAIVAEVERLHWRIWNGKAKNAKRSIDRIRSVMHVFRGENGHDTKGVPSRKLWRALREVDRYLRGQSNWLVNYASATGLVYLSGPPRNWGSGGNGGWREFVVGWMEFLSEFGTERTVVDRAPDLKQQVRAAS